MLRSRRSGEAEITVQGDSTIEIGYAQHEMIDPSLQNLASSLVSSPLLAGDIKGWAAH
jgi:hypothetical protein